MKPFEEFEQDRNHIKSKEDYMVMAIKAAQHAASRGDVPVGALLVWSDQMMSEANTIYSDEDMTHHAEMNVMRKAAQVNFRKLRSATLYSTLEPCSMCAAAAYWNGITEIVFGAFDDKYGFASSKSHGINFESYGIKYKGGILAQECFDILPKKIQEYCCIK